jgi:recombination protein RecA
LHFRLLFAYIPHGENMANIAGNTALKSTALRSTALRSTAPRSSAPRSTALAVLETALRERKLDRTLTTALPPLERSDPAAFMPFDIAAMDAVLRDGLPRGQVSELAGPHSSGRTTLLLQLLSAATRGREGAATRAREIAALVDTCDRLDVASASAAGIDLDRLLWIRGDGGPFDSLRSLRAGPDRIVDRALKALNLVLQAGGFGVVVIDLADVPLRVLKSLPFTTWLRVQRIVEGSDTACVLVVPEPLARSAGGLTVMCTGQTTWAGPTEGARLTAGLSAGASAKAVRFTGLETQIRVVSPRRRVDGGARITAVASEA